MFLTTSSPTILVLSVTVAGSLSTAPERRRTELRPRIQPRQLTWNDNSRFGVHHSNSAFRPISLLFRCPERKPALPHVAGKT